MLAVGAGLSRQDSLRPQGPAALAIASRPGKVKVHRGAGTDLARNPQVAADLPREGMDLRKPESPASLWS